MFRKRMLAIALGLVLVLVLAPFAGAEKMAQKQEFIFNSLGEPDSLDPALSTGVKEATLEGMMLEGLIRLDENMSPVPGMAERWETNEDVTEFIFYIREDAVWSDGKPVTAHDFEYSMKRVLDPMLAAEYAYMLYYIKNAEAYNADPDSGITVDDVGVKALDDKTLKITLEAPCPYFLQMLAHNSYLPVRKDMVEANPEGWATKAETYMANGPFKMVSWNHNSDITFVKNELYWDAENVKLDRIVANLIDNIDTAVTVFLNGELDMVESPSSQFIDQLKAQGKYFSQPGMLTYYYTINGTREGLDNPLVRKALSLAINRQIIVEQITRGGQIPAFALVPPGMADANPEEDFREVGGDYFVDYDVATAKALLAEAGYPNGQGLPEFEILYNTGVTSHEQIALAIQSWWEQIGVKTRLVGQEWGVYLNSRTQLDYEIARAGWGADYLDPMSFLDLFQTGVGLNDTGYSNPTYDTLINIAKMTDNQKIRMLALHEAERILIEDMVIIPIYYYTNEWAVQPYVRDIIHNPTGTKDFKYVWIAEH